MANEIQLQTTADVNVYALIRNASAQVWSFADSEFVTYADADLGDYDLALTEQGTSSGYYVASFPSTITTPGNYNVTAYKRAGASPAVSDEAVGQGVIVWDGAAEVDQGSSDLVTLAEAKSYCGITDDGDDAFVEFVIDAITAEVEKFCDRTFSVQTYTEYHDAFPGVLQLDRYPIVTLTSVTYGAQETSPTVVAADQFVVDSALGRIALKPDATVERSSWYCSPSWRSIKVIYSAGAAAPDDVRLAALKLAARAYDSRDRDMNLTNEKIGDWSASFDFRGLLAEDAEVYKTLFKHRRISL